MKEIPKLSTAAQALKKGVYRHFKGDEVRVIDIALHSETQEELVVYRHITGERASESYHWVRPLKMFLDIVERDNHKGPRFTFLRDK